MSFELDDAIESARRDGYEEGCRDAHKAAWEDVGEIVGNDGEIDWVEALAELRENVRKYTR